MGAGTEDAVHIAVRISAHGIGGILIATAVHPGAVLLMVDHGRAM